MDSEGMQYLAPTAWADQLIRRNTLGKSRPFAALHWSEAAGAARVHAVTPVTDGGWVIG